MKCGLCDGNHLTIGCPRLADSADKSREPASRVDKQASSVGKQALAQPKAHSHDSDRKPNAPLVNVNTVPVSTNTEPVNTNAVCARCIELEQRIADLEARLGSRSQYMREYMRSYRARKVPG